VPSKREARADDALNKLKKRARLEERLLLQPLNPTLLQPAVAAVAVEGRGEGEDVAMSSTLQAAKVRVSRVTC